MNILENQNKNESGSATQQNDNHKTLADFIKARREAFEPMRQKLADYFNYPNLEMTVRGHLEFTFSTEEVNREIMQGLCVFFASDPRAIINVEHDEECGSFFYLTIKE